MPHRTIRTLLLRELRALRREVEAYPDDASLWAVPEGVRNSAGALVLHLAGNLRHFVGAILGGTGYVRDRQAEFGRRDLARAELLEEIDVAGREVDAALRDLDPARLGETFPVSIGGRRPTTEAFLMHLVAHLAYHLGQVDYHRRLTTADPMAVDAVSVADLAEPGA